MDYNIEKIESEIKTINDRKRISFTENGNIDCKNKKICILNNPDVGTDAVTRTYLENKLQSLHKIITSETKKNLENSSTKLSESLSKMEKDTTAHFTIIDMKLGDIEAKIKPLIETVLNLVKHTSKITTHPKVM